MSRLMVKLPIRIWLAVALVVVVAVPVLTTWWLGDALSTWQQQAQQARLDNAIRLVSNDVAHWDDPAWQRRVRPQLAALHVVVQLFNGKGSLVYDSLVPAGVMDTKIEPPFMTTSPVQVASGTICSGNISGAVRSGGTPATPGSSAPNVTTRTLACTAHTNAGGIAVDGFSSSGDIPGAVLKSAGQVRLPRTSSTVSAGVEMVGEGVTREIIQARGPHGRAPVVQGTVYLLPAPDPGTALILQAGGVSAQFLSVAGLPWVVPLGALAALLATLAFLSLLLQRTILRPLAAMRRAARQIAGGDLEVHMAPATAREVAEVAEALEAMSAALRAALERQDDLEEQRRLFIAAIAHDLRTPLFTLRAHLLGLRDGLAAAPDKAVSYVAVCCEKADALERLISDLFAYTRVEYLEEVPRTEPLDLRALLQQTVTGLQPQAAARDILLQACGPEQPAVLAGDGQLLTRVMENVLDNALRHTPAGGWIGVSWREEAMAVIFTVEDSGPGIAARDLPHLFTPLYRGEMSRNRQTGGAGLGLAIARRIMQAHGGDLIAANRPEGGAVFTGTLPIGRRAPVRATPLAATT